MNYYHPKTPPKKWYIGQWPALAWIETVIKLVALGLALFTAITTLTHANFGPPIGKAWIQLVILGLLSIGLLIAIYDRILEREIIAMSFVLLNNLGHWGMLLALFGDRRPSQALLLFCMLMLAGDLVKLIFLRVHKFGVRDTPRAVLYGLTSIYAAGYLIIALLELLN